ncbi:unnamed protein product [Polarella glacialis]|uniref:Uncharacterized protein n=1 Tax=Polarella glacialis TaxID=89957 RepID=A0A813E8E1_POLGL|nr:unnamed protein product [Polarella glacialis]
MLACVALFVYKAAAYEKDRDPPSDAELKTDADTGKDRDPLSGAELKTDADCKWDYRNVACAPPNRCEYRYQGWDVTLDQSCRLKLKPSWEPKSDEDCKWHYPNGGCSHRQLCEYNYQFGDMSLDQSCRLKFKTTTRNGCSEQDMESIKRAGPGSLSSTGTFPWIVSQCVQKSYSFGGNSVSAQ